MTIEDVLKNSDRLKQNFQELCNHVGITHLQGQDFNHNILTMHTTHTFGYEKRFFLDIARTIKHVVYPYQAILINDKALLSDLYRSGHSKKVKGESERKMDKAREYGLDNYVFAYLGSHEYYYADSDGMNIPAFGVFLSYSLDYDKNTNVTLYDLKSDLGSAFTPEQMTLTPQDARILTAHEITLNFRGDFFSYWICDAYASKAYHESDMWKHKREFHYWEKVELADIEAIIWPIELVEDEDTSQPVPRYGVMAEITEFKRNHPAANVYKYEWIATEAEDRFAYASYLISSHYYLTNTYLKPEDFYDRFTEQFPI